MKLIRASFASIEQHLALDEALLEQAEFEFGIAIGDESKVEIPSSECPLECLRVWEMPRVGVVVGRGSKLADEVDLLATSRDQIPVYRRCSGGTSVVVGPGCLMYSVVLSYAHRPHLRMLDQAHRFVMKKIHSCVARFLPEVRIDGTCDLTWNDRKFSGNALRCKRHFLLYHGTLLCRFPIDRIGRYLRQPPRQPDYRRHRSHSEFLTNLDIDPPILAKALEETWDIRESTESLPALRFLDLLGNRYQQKSWHEMR
jgi:lipoate-protein ligase A